MDGMRCEAKPTTLKRPSLGDGVENHMYVCILKMISSHATGVHVILNHFVYCSRVGLLKGPTGGLGNTSAQGYSPCTFDYPLLHFAIARVLLFLHCYMADWFLPQRM